MAFRWDIPERLIYTCNCGWFDKGHANGVAAGKLWKNILDEKDKYRQNRLDGYKLTYSQDTISAGITFNKHSQDFFIKGNLSNIEKEQVALAIFQEVSLGFEQQQLSSGIKGFFVENFGPASGFSEEDLVSNIAGFYKAMRGTIWENLCKPVSKEASLKIWDTDGPVGWNKNHTFLPKFHECDECPANPQFPFEYQVIKPIEKGILHFDFDPNGALAMLDESQLRFQRNLFSGAYFSGFGYRTIPREVTLTVGLNESLYHFARRALIKAAFVMMLPLWEQMDFAEQFYPLNVGSKVINDFKLNYTSGDPSDDRDNSVKVSEFNALSGKDFTYRLDDQEHNELKKRKEHYTFTSPRRFFAN